eukprot:TRINITY_DN28097_c0_g1_i1.p1 TRINITY_DN28097_c0_g1~~TRINITY_DN28097_c0_g1_i1.p1  ORF type:complete len:1485 (+),score=403.05 TRINITY_DN28097_c0_g1_i1:52-4455(+)
MAAAAEPRCGAQEPEGSAALRPTRRRRRCSSVCSSDCGDCDEASMPSPSGVDRGYGFTCSKPWIGTIQDAEPSTWTAALQRQSVLPPAASLVLDHVHGYRARGVRNNARFVDDDTLLYFAAALGIVHDVATNRQYFYPPNLEYSKPRQEVTSLDYHADLRLVATGTLGAHNSAELNVWAIDEAARTTKHLSTMSGELEFAVISCCFNSDGSKVAAVGADEQHTVCVYAWRTSTLLAKGFSPQRNRVHDLRWVPAGFPVDAPLTGEHFITACWKGVYFWNAAPATGSEHANAKRLATPAKGKLHPKLDIGSKGGLQRLSFFGNESFTSVAFSPYHVIAASTSGLVYLFKTEPARGAGSRFYMMHAFPAGRPALQPEGVPSEVPPDPAQIRRANDATKMSLAERAYLTHTSAATSGVVEEMLGVTATFAVDEYHCKEAAAAAEECHQCREAIDSEWKRVTAAQKSSAAPLNLLLAPLGSALTAFHESLANLQCFAEEAWGSAAQGADSANLDRADDVRERLEAAESTTAIQSLSQRLKPEPGKAGPRRAHRDLLSREAWVAGKKLWGAEILRLDHWRQCVVEMGKDKKRTLPDYSKVGSADATTSTEATEPASAVSCLWCYGEPGSEQGYGRYLICGAKNGVVRIFDLFPDGVDAGPKQSLAARNHVWELDLNVWDSSTNNMSTSASNSIRSLHINPERGLLLVGTLTSNILTVEYDFTFQSTGGRPNVHCEVEGHHGDLKASSRKRNPQPAGYGELWGLAAHPFKPQVATTTEDSSLRVWDVKHCERIKRRRLSGLGWSCAYSHDGRLITVGFKSGSFAIYDSETLQRLWPHVSDTLEKSRFRQWRVADIKFSPNDALIGVASFNFLDLYTVLRDPVTGIVNGVDYKGTCNGLTSPVTRFDFSGCSSFVQVVNKSYELIFFDVGQREQRWRFLQLTRGRSLRDEPWDTHSCTLGWNVQGIWANGMDGSDINSCGRTVGTLTDRPLVAVGNDAETVRLYRYPCVGGGLDPWGRCRYRPACKEYVGHASHVTGCVFSNNNAHLFTTGGRDCCLFQWRVIREDRGPVSPRSPKFRMAFTDANRPPSAEPRPAGPELAEIVSAIGDALRDVGPYSVADERVVLRCLGRIRGQGEWEAVQTMFAEKYPGVASGSLRSALTAALTKRALSDAKAVLLAGGCEWKTTAAARVASEKAGGKVFDTIDADGDGVLAERDVARFLAAHPELRQRLRPDRQDEFKTRWSAASEATVSRKEFRKWWADCAPVSVKKAKEPKPADASDAETTASRRRGSGRGSRRRSSSVKKVRRRASAQFASTAPGGRHAGLGTFVSFNATAPSQPAVEPDRPRTRAWLRDNHVSVTQRTTTTATRRRASTMRHLEELERSRQTAPVPFTAGSPVARSFHERWQEQGSQPGSPRQRAASVGSVAGSVSGSPRRRKSAAKPKETAMQKALNACIAAKKLKSALRSSSQLAV